jgi:hypothetical protein
MRKRRVFLLPSPRMTTCGAWSALKRKRRTLWHNAARNAQIARVARACLEEDVKALREMGVPLRKRKDGVWSHHVAVLVENVEHAEELVRWLPGWEMLAAVQEPVDDEEEQGMPLMSDTIITWMHAWRFEISANIVIRATGWRGKLDLGDGNRWGERSKRRQVIIDFEDSWDADAVEDTEHRVQEYEAQNLEVVRSKQKCKAR